MTYSEQTDSVYTRPLNIYRALLYTLYNDDRGEAGISELYGRRTSVNTGPRDHHYASPTSECQPDYEICSVLGRTTAGISA